ncbi:hypothetical protein GmHk_04G010462 [Glycine max]|nr:hypothetical protein GmHk_04G010462 [Glycine max]
MRESERERETEREQESGRDQESSREGENGWVRVKHRTQTKERNSEKVREDPHRRHAGSRQGQGQSYGRANWRSRKNITSFYFTRFPDDTTEEELWYHFKVFGAVREIFIAKNRNKHGRRFGFVRFEGVENAQKLEWTLDNIVFGGLKMHVNIPKFGRNKVVKPISVTNKVRQDVHKEEAIPRYVQPISTTHHGSYAEVVARNNTGPGLRRIAGNASGHNGTSWSSVYLDIPKSLMKRAKEAWVGRLKNLAMFDRVEDDLYWDISADISPKYMGADMVLLQGLSDEGAELMMQEETEGGSTPFHSLEKWSPKLRIEYRLTWVYCWGLPLTDWDTHQIRKIVAAIGDMVDVDDAVELVRRMDRVWVLVKTPRQPYIQHAVNVHIHGEVYTVHVVEENGNSSDNCYGRKGSVYGSSEEVESDDSEAGTLNEISNIEWMTSRRWRSRR